MGDAIYRDPLVATRARVQELEIEVAERQSRLTDAAYDRLPADLVARIRPRDDAASTDATLDDLARAEADLSRRKAALDEAIALVPEVEQGLMVLPDEAPPFPPHERRTVGDVLSSLFFSNAPEIAQELRVAAAELEPLVRAHDPTLSVQRFDDGALGVRFRALGAPLVATATPRSDHIVLYFATSVRPGAPRVVVRAAGWVRTSAPLGDPTFDDRFAVEGDSVARTLVGTPVRNALVEVARFDVPRLEVHEGVASITLRFDPTAVVVNAAIHALARLREAPFDLALLRPATRPPPSR